MSREGYVVLMYDIQMKDSKDRREYNIFYRMLRKYGFAMLQESIYFRFLKNIDNSDVIINKTKCILPVKSQYNFLVLTSKQFEEMNNNSNKKIDIGNISENIIII